MTISVSLHRLKKVETKTHNGSTWLDMTANDGSQVTIFIPYDVAQRMERAFKGEERV
jgi:hypothetical protein